MKGEFPYQIRNPPTTKTPTRRLPLEKKSKQEKGLDSVSRAFFSSSLLRRHGLRFEFERAVGALGGPPGSATLSSTRPLSLSRFAGHTPA